jgi:hypothetical protein
LISFGIDCAALGPYWGHFEVQVGCQNGAKSDQKTITKSINTLIPFGIDVRQDYDPSWGPKENQVGTNIEAKRLFMLERPKLMRIYGFLHCNQYFRGVDATILRAKIEEKSIKN